MTQQRQDFITHMTTLDNGQTKGVARPIRLKDTTERAAKRQATQRAKDFGIELTTPRWKGRGSTTSRNGKNSLTGKWCCIIVQRVSKLTR